MKKKVVFLFSAAAVALLLCAFQVEAKKATSTDVAPSGIQLIIPPQSNKERIPTEDKLIPNMHCMGLINEHANIFRSGNPVRDLVVPAKKSTTPLPTPEEAKVQAEARMQQLYKLGIRTIFCFQHPNGQEKEEVTLEKNAAEKVGITFVSRPLSNSGAGSFEDMSTSDVLNKLMPICTEITNSAKQDGGVLFHCKAGHDRTGIVAALLRVKWQGWSAQEAINEMRALGHNPEKFSKENGTKNSWIEQHVVNAEKILAVEK